MLTPRQAKPIEIVPVAEKKSARWIPVSEVNLCGNEQQYVMDCMNTGWVSANGPYVAKFEKAFADYCSVEQAMAICNGTCALHLALVALGIGPGDEVIVPSFTYIATANAVKYTGATPVFVDSQTSTWNIDPKKIEAAISSKTRAIIPVHLYGLSCDMDPILDIAKRHNLYVVEDAAEAFGSEYKDRPAGSLGTIGVFSFFGNKTITTGEGGMIVTNDPKLADKVRLLRGQGVSPTRQYYFEVVGYNYRMTNVQAAIGLGQIENADYFIDQKRKNARLYRDLLEGVDGITLAKEKSYAFHSYWMYSILVEDRFGMSRDELMKKLREKGIETRPFFYPCHLLPPYQGTHTNLEVAESIGKKGINLPSSTKLTKEDIVYITDSIKACAK